VEVFDHRDLTDTRFADLDLAEAHFVSCTGHRVVESL